MIGPIMLFKNLIHIPGKNFSNLTKLDAANMIEAFLANGSEDYDPSALTEFMLVPSKVEWLEKLRLNLIAIDQNRKSLKKLDGLSSDDAIADLGDIVTELREASSV